MPDPKFKPFKKGEIITICVTNEAGFKTLPIAEASAYLACKPRCPICEVLEKYNDDEKQTPEEK